MKVIICGSRTVNDPFVATEAVKWFCQACRLVPGLSSANDQGIVTEVVSGCSKGADLLGEHWARTQSPSIPICRMKPNFNAKMPPFLAALHNSKKMAQYADAMIALWDGISPGTKQMVDEMKKLGKPVVRATIAKKMASDASHSSIVSAAASSLGDAKYSLNTEKYFLEFMAFNMQKVNQLVKVSEVIIEDKEVLSNIEKGRKDLESDEMFEEEDDNGVCSSSDQVATLSSIDGDLSASQDENLKSTDDFQFASDNALAAMMVSAKASGQERCEPPVARDWAPSSDGFVENEDGDRGEAPAGFETEIVDKKEEEESAKATGKRKSPDTVEKKSSGKKNKMAELVPKDAKQRSLASFFVKQA